MSPCDWTPRRSSIAFGSARFTLAFLGLAVAVMILPAAPAHALRVTTWNVTNYPTSNLAVRQPHFRTVMAALQTDVMIVQEMSSSAGTDSFMNVLMAAQPKRWKSAFISTTESAIYWDSSKVEVPSVSAFNPPSGPRDVLIAVVKPLGYVDKAGWFRVYSIHLKAGQAASDTTTRRLECSEIRSNINSVNPSSSVGPNFVIGGDSNFYTALEGGYVFLTVEQIDNDGRCKDPLLLPGPWHENSGYKLYHTQCPCLTGCPSGFSGGGMDDRFDLWLSSYTMQDGQGLDLVLPGGYIAYGNDGQHYNDDINGGGFNNAVGITVANALHASADHLPVIMTLQLPSRVVAGSEMNFGDAIVGAAVSQNLQVSNGAVAPADALDYSFSAPAGFIAPAGSFSDAAGGGANLHAIDLDTASSGIKVGTLTVTTDDPDSLLKSVPLSGRVLDHAAASLDSAALSTASIVSFGAHPPGEFSDRLARVHNFDYDALQARLSVYTGVITGGVGRFTLPGGFSPALVADVGATYPVHFDDAGATLDSTYEATLTFQTTDEPLPGAAAGSDLVVTLRARVGTEATGVQDPLLAVRFHPPHPNPFAGVTLFAFDLPESAPVSLEIFDLSGRRVASLVSGTREAGRHQARWESTDESGGRVPAGLYFARFVTTGLTQSCRVAVLP